MIIECSDEQVKKMAAAAINSSSPMGLGFLHFDPNMRVKSEELQIRDEAVSIDYFQGKMVKFQARKIENGKWDFYPDEISSEYQSWIRDYDSYQSLFNAVAKE